MFFPLISEATKIFPRHSSILDLNFIDSTALSAPKMINHKIGNLLFIILFDVSLRSFTITGINMQGLRTEIGT